MVYKIHCLITDDLHLAGSYIFRHLVDRGVLMASSLLQNKKLSITLQVTSICALFMVQT